MWFVDVWLVNYSRLFLSFYEYDTDINLLETPTTVFLGSSAGVVYLGTIAGLKKLCLKNLHVAFKTRLYFEYFF